MVWMLSQFYTDPESGFSLPVCIAYGNGFYFPEPPGSTGWALVQVNSNANQIAAAMGDSRVETYRTLFDPITANTLAAYTAQGAAQGMMLGQLLQLLAKNDLSYITSMA